MNTTPLNIYEKLAVFKSLLLTLEEATGEKRSQAHSDLIDAIENTITSGLNVIDATELDGIIHKFYTELQHDMRHLKTL